MKFKLIVLFILISLFGCKVQKYYLTSDNSMLDSYKSKRVYDSETLVPVAYNHIKNKIILIPVEFTSDSVIRETISLIQQKKYGKLKKYLSGINSADSYLPISNGLLEIYKGNYTDAISELKKNNVSGLEHVIDILLIDCEYEISILSYEDIDYMVFLEKYQAVLDIYSLSDDYKVIINDRMKFVRYKK